MTCPLPRYGFNPAHTPASAPSTDFSRDVLQGLTSTPKTLPCKYLYDARGAELFTQIARLPEYYPTRTETAILDRNAADIAARIGPGRLVIEPGSGDAAKTRRLLAALHRPAGYVPIDISAEQLADTAAALSAEFPGLPIFPAPGDFTGPELTIPREAPADAPRLVYFPGSTVGNFEPEEARGLLARFAQLARHGTDAHAPAALLIGVDLVKDPRTLEAAYDDSAGVTAAFNLNLLHRINRELDPPPSPPFDPAAFRHLAVYNRDLRRIEMHLVSRRDQTHWIGNTRVRFAAGETIHTESSHKYTIPAFHALAAEAGWRPTAAWTDPNTLFATLLLHLP